MTELSDSELRRIDLTLLLVFLGLLRHRKALDVAAELGLTQSAISQALRRLRDIFGDDLFIRRPHGMEPTAIALALEPPVSAAVETLRGALGSALRFDPKRAEGIVRIAALDAEQATTVPRLLTVLRTEAPMLNLSVLPFGHGQALDALRTGQVDLAIGVQFEQPPEIQRQILFVEDYQVAGRSEILGAPGGMDLDAYCDHLHILTSPSGDLKGIVDVRLSELGRSRRVISAFPNFFPAMAAAYETKTIVTLPSRVAETFATSFGLRVTSVPLELKTQSRVCGHSS